MSVDWTTLSILYSIQIGNAASWRLIPRKPFYESAGVIQRATIDDSGS